MLLSIGSIASAVNAPDEYFVNVRSSAPVLARYRFSPKAPAASMYSTPPTTWRLSSFALPPRAVELLATPFATRSPTANLRKLLSESAEKSMSEFGAKTMASCSLLKLNTPEFPDVASSPTIAMPRVECA